jgi:hypothetical protein
MKRKETEEAISLKVMLSWKSPWIRLEKKPASWQGPKFAEQSGLETTCDYMVCSNSSQWPGTGIEEGVTWDWRRRRAGLWGKGPNETRKDWENIGGWTWAWNTGDMGGNADMSKLRILFIYYFGGSRVWTQVLQLWSRYSNVWATSLVNFVLIILEMGSCKLFAQASLVLLISASQVAGIIGVSYQHPAKFDIFKV